MGARSREGHGKSPGFGLAHLCVNPASACGLGGLGQVIQGCGLFLNCLLSEEAPDLGVLLRCLVSYRMVPCFFPAEQLSQSTRRGGPGLW